MHANPTEQQTLLTFIVRADIAGHGLTDQTQRQPGVGGRRLGRHDLAHSGAEELRVALDAQIHFVDEAQRRLTTGIGTGGTCGVGIVTRWVKMWVNEGIIKSKIQAEMY